ncbi:hypothetical protein EQM14_01745 [Caproiciproducens sp. NJN-50]|uniref:hypothetical protein n=1 Tax=Caproiciproducens sp. NJN-50 TaxID=2507162 RepID=UPI000FFE1371|nr:hypothetical protein [Caproiciproducens sp. NJN-50]QAT48607.1 hypothetical protein EQM14_01745 [Caproiciproducens sp. NJN-50]
MELIKANIKEQGTEMLLNCFTLMNGTAMEANERLVFAVITDELESRGAVRYDEETEEYSVCA